MSKGSLLLMATVLVVALSAGAAARPVQLWSNADLWKKAELVVVGMAVGTKDTPVEYGRKPKPDTWVSVDTTFKVEAVAKGSLKAPTVSLRHNRHYGPEAEVQVIDGPSFIRFNPAKKRTYLLFMKRGADGSWEPLTGQYDPWQSVQVLNGFHTADER